MVKKSCENFVKAGMYVREYIKCNNYTKCEDYVSKNGLRNIKNVSHPTLVLK